MIKLLRNKCNCRAFSSPPKLKFSGSPVSINIIDTHNRSGERGNLSEGDEEWFVYLSLRVDVRAAEQENQPPDGKYRRCDYLQVKLRHNVFSFSAAKVVQKNEPTKKVGSQTG